MPFVLLNSVIVFVGLLITAYSSNSGARYFRLFLRVCGCNANLPAIIAFQSNNVRSDSRRAVANGIQFLFAAIGGIYSSTTFDAEGISELADGRLVWGGDAVCADIAVWSHGKHFCCGYELCVISS